MEDSVILHDYVCQPDVVVVVQASAEVAEDALPSQLGFLDDASLFEFVVFFVVRINEPGLVFKDDDKLSH